MARIGVADEKFLRIAISYTDKGGSFKPIRISGAGIKEKGTGKVREY